MPICKILENYDNTERWVKNQTVEITNPTQLIKEGKVVLLNEKGEEIAPPGTPMKCPICLFEGKDPVDLANHILDKHAKKSTEEKAATSTKVGAEDQKAKKREEFLARMQRGRELKKQEQMAQNALKEAKEALKVAKG